MTDRLMNCLRSADWLLLAQNGGAPRNQGPGLLELVLPFVVLFTLFYFLVLGPSRREQKRRQAMLAALKKNDRVLTQGGVIGTVANISADGQKVSVKVDDNVRLLVHRGYIVTVLTDEQAEGETKTT